MNKTQKRTLRIRRMSKTRGKARTRGMSKRRGGAASGGGAAYESESERLARIEAQKIRAAKYSPAEYSAKEKAYEQEALFRKLYPEKARQKERDTQKNWESANEWEARKKRMNAYDASIQAEQTRDAMVAREGRSHQSKQAPPPSPPQKNTYKRSNEEFWAEYNGFMRQRMKGL
jgi:hypothetical protein